MTLVADAPSAFAPTPADASPDTLSAEEKRDLARAEREIAKKYIGVFPTFMVTWWIANLTVWISIWPLTLTGQIPLWLGGLISFVCIATCYLPSHESQHGNVGQPGTKWRWLNELIGRTATIPLVYGYLALRITHMQHHAHANHPEKDPDYANKSKNSFDFLGQYIKRLQPGSNDTYGRFIADHPDKDESARAVQEQMVLQSLFLITMVGMAWSGFAIEAAVLWWLPKMAAGAYISYFLSWAPHHPFEALGRYRDTRAWKCLMGGNIGNIIALGMEYHIVHHLHPNIPLNYTPRSYREMRPILVKRGCQIDGL